jgi:2-aminoadipate transaminase
VEKSTGFFYLFKLKLMARNETLFLRQYSNRINLVPRSFIRDILKVIERPDIISFAGGLPNKNFFPVNEIKEAAIKVLETSASSALQYSISEGLVELREKIAETYLKSGIRVSPEQILITSGSQQALDLIGKVFINKGDNIVLEEPAYLGAIQAFSMYQPKFLSVPLHKSGMDINILSDRLKRKVKLLYLVPNFQNPTGISYSKENRSQIADLVRGTQTLLIEDDPYGLIRFKGRSLESVYTFAPQNTILLGTFSKTIAPGLRIGWMVIPENMYSKFVIAKQASDLHSDVFAQHVLVKCLSILDLDKHLGKICSVYKEKAECMLGELGNNFPGNVNYTEPEGGMFIWVTLPEGCSSMELFNESIKENVAFVPGDPFYLGKTNCNTLRLNFSCSEIDEIKKGIVRLSRIYEKKFYFV